MDNGDFLYPFRSASRGELSQLVAPWTGVWAFIDGTLRGAGPLYEQKRFYNGWKRKHALKFQSLITPDSMTAALDGPIEGRRHDLTLLRENNWINSLRKHIVNSTRYRNCEFLLNGDSRTSVDLKRQQKGFTNAGLQKPTECLPALHSCLT